MRVRKQQAKKMQEYNRLENDEKMLNLTGYRERVQARKAKEAAAQSKAH